MTHRFSRRSILSLMASAVAAPAFADAPSRSLRPIARGGQHAKKAVRGSEQLVANAKLGGRVSFAVADMKSGLVLEERASTVGLPPASVTKAVTALYALDTLGAGYQFETRLIASGALSNGVLNGDLILAGGGDPGLNTDALAVMAKRLKSAGLREVRGRFLVYGGAIARFDEIDPEQPDHVGYNPAVSGLNLNFNRVHFEWKRGGNGYQVSMDGRSRNYRPDVSFAKMRIVNRDLPIYTYKSANGQDNWTVAKSALGKGGARWLPVRKPEIYAGEVFQTFARAQGIALKSPRVVKQSPRGTTLVRHQSAPLRDILQDMLKFSTNLTAEVVGLAATAKRKGRPQSLKASARVMSNWARAELGMKKSAFADHSGLSDASRTSASDMMQAMIRADRRGLAPIMKDIAMRDARGRRIKNHPIKVQAKTGTLNFVSGLAGYMRAADGTRMAFAIFSADTARRDRLSMQERERPQGAGGWNKRAKKLQQGLIERWGALYGS